MKQSEREYTEKELRAFTSLMIKKVGMFAYIEDPAKRLEAQIFQVVIDTCLLADGSVPLERWLEET